MIPTHPNATQAFRLGTQKKTLTGVMSPTFRCAKCNKYRHTSCRKKLGKGYKCAQCVSMEGEN